MLRHGTMAGVLGSRRRRRRWRRVRIGEREVGFARDPDGTARIHGEDALARAAGLGYAHGLDRPTQLLLVRAAAQGRLCEVLVDDESSLAVDRFSRERGFAFRARRAAAALHGEAGALAEAYAEGVRQGMRRLPWELRVLGMPVDFCTWEPADTLATMELMSYVGLASLQEDLERVLVDAVRRRVPLARLREWWYPHLECLDEDLADRLCALNHWQGPLPGQVRARLESAAPALARASNAWAVDGRRTASGFPLFACDPHLETSRLPAIWYEVALEGPSGPDGADAWLHGVTVPGVPGVLMGRSCELAFGFTYGFMDQVDFFVEEVRGGRCRRAGDGPAGTDSEPARVRTERLRRRRGPDVSIQVRETGLGVLEDGGNARDGRFLTRAWAGARADWGAALVAVDRLGAARTVAEAQQLARSVPLSANWVLADRRGTVGWCLAGAAPHRPDGGAGLAPARGWDPARVWRPGLLPSSALPYGGPDPSGVVASANDPRPPSSTGAVLVSAAMGSDRVDRIHELLGERDHHGVDCFVSMQQDCLSMQGRRWRERLRQAGVLRAGTGSPAALELMRWSGRDAAASAAADRMELFWSELLAEVYGRGLFGEASLDAYRKGTSVVAMYWAHFDDGAARFGPRWVGERDVESLCRRVWRRVEAARRVPERPWSRITFAHLLFGGRLPRWIGLDRGPFRVDGGRSTLHQLQEVRAHGQHKIVAPSFRLVCDLGTDEAWTSLAGGARDRPFSRHYAGGLRGWLLGEPTRRAPSSVGR